MRIQIVLTVVLALVLATGGVFAQEVDLVALEKKMWGFAVAKNWPELKARFAPTHLMVDEHGVSDLKRTMEALKKMDLRVSSLTDFKVTRTGPVAVITYKADVAETVDGKRIRRQNAPRATVWLKTDKGWLTVMHSNFNPIGK